MPNYRLRIEQDTNPESPREWDNPGTLLTWERDRHSPDENPYRCPEEFEDEMEAVLAAGGVVLPVYRYSHSGDDYSTAPYSCPWDSGQVGWIYAYPTDEVPDLAACLVAEVETFAQWVRGDVWGYIVEDENGEYLDMCWGIYGREDAELEGHAAVDSFRASDLFREETVLRFINAHCAA